MLEALVAVCPSGERGINRRGDVLCVKLAGSPWGELERRFHQVIRWQDDALEARLVAMRSRANPHPVISLPYAEYVQQKVATDPRTRKQLSTPVLTVRSSRYLDVAALPAQLQARVLDPSTTVTPDELEPHRQSAQKTRLD